MKFSEGDIIKNCDNMRHTLLRPGGLYVVLRVKAPWIPTGAYNEISVCQLPELKELTFASGLAYYFSSSFFELIEDNSEKEQTL